MRRRGIIAAILAGAFVVAGCGSAPAASPAPSAAAPTPAAAAPATPPIAVPSLAPAATLVLPSGADITLDPSLLSVLPSTVGGVPVTQEPESFAEAVKDPAFVASVDRAVFAIAVSGGDLASGVVAHLRDGVYSDQMFSDWRSSYDEGACSQSGSPVAHAESTLDGRTIYVTTCGGGLRIYHTYLPSRGVIVSLFSTGPGDFGGQLVQAARG